MENSQYLGYFVQYNALFIVIVVFENIYLSMEKITGGGVKKKARHCCRASQKPLLGLNEVKHQ